MEDCTNNIRYDCQNCDKTQSCLALRNINNFRGAVPPMPTKADKTTFSNSTMQAPIEYKPHIALKDGYWRVSKVKVDLYTLWYRAHTYASKLNNLRMEPY